MCMQERGNKMVLIEISEEVWQKFKSACAVNNIKSHSEVIQTLEFIIRAEAEDWLDAAQSELVSLAPEALFWRIKGLAKERKRSMKSCGTSSEEANITDESAHQSGHFVSGVEGNEKS